MEDITRGLEKKIEEQQHAIDELTRRLNVLSDVYNDLKNIEHDQEVHTLLATPHDEDVDSDERRGKKKKDCFCC